MASDSNSSSSSSTSSSDDDQSAASAINEQTFNTASTDKDNIDTIIDESGTATTEEDDCKVFISRIPQTFNEDSVRRILNDKFGDGCVMDVSLVSPKEEDDEATTNEKRALLDSDPTEKKEHRGFGFVTFSSKSICDEAIKCGTVRGSAKEASKRKHTLYIQQVVREEIEDSSAPSDSAIGKNICFLWKKFRCPYGDECKFVHDGEGGCASSIEGTGKKAKVQKCFSFKKRGNCKLGEKCPFSHEMGKTDGSTIQGKDANEKEKDRIKDNSAKDCISWKSKGKCRKGDRCPYKHDESVRIKALSKKTKAALDTTTDGLSKTKRKLQERENKVKQSLSIRVFGMNYSTTKEDIHAFFSHCGKIVEITFPTYEDSGRSKGYCGILFASPKAAQKAVEEMNERELHGRWLSVQSGKMFLRKWEEGERVRRDGGSGDGDGQEGTDKVADEEPLIGEYGQRVKKRKKHGFAN